MSSNHTEKERKFDGLVDAALPGLDGIPGVAEVSDPGVEELDAVYYDTADLRLLDRGITLRRRTGGHDSGWHLKLPVGPDERQELQLPLSAGGPNRVPRALVLRTRGHGRGAALVPVVHLHTQRHRRLLLDDHRRTLAEIAQDAVSAQVLAPERLSEQAAADAAPHGRAGGAKKKNGNGSSTVVTAWTEVEAELVEGGTGLLDAVEQHFAGVGLHRSTSHSKLARALGRDGDAPAALTLRRSGRGTAGSVGAALTELLRDQAAELLALDPAVRVDEEDAVHRMRVAVRRLRSTLRTHRRLLADEPATALTEELRWLGSVLGEARDREVLGERLGAQIGRLAPEECPGPVRERVASWASSQYRRSWKRATTTLESPRYYTLLDTVEALATRPPLQGRADRGAVAEFRRAARREQRRVAGRIADAVVAPAGPERDEALHGVRKAAKRARYAAEGAVPTVGGRARKLARRMKDVQQLLGERQDALLACAALPELALVAHRAGEPGFGYGVLYAGQRASIAETDQELPATWRAARSRRLTRFD